MIREKRPIWFLLTTVVLAGSAPGALAQQPPWPNGCSVGLGFYIQQGIDGIFLDACDAHDQCWAECNGLAPPYHGLAHRQQCDTDFLYDMETACALEAAFIVFPAGGFDDAEGFAVRSGLQPGWLQHCRRGGAQDLRQGLRPRILLPHRRTAATAAAESVRADRLRGVLRHTDREGLLSRLRRSPGPLLGAAWCG